MFFQLTMLWSIALPSHADRASVKKTQVVERSKIKADLVAGKIRLALAADGTTLFVANDKDPRIQVHGATTEGVRRFDSQLNDVQCLALSPNGEMLAIGGDGLIVFAVSNNRICFHHKKFRRVDSVHFSSDNRYLVFGTVDMLVRSVKVPNGETVRTFPGLSGPVRTVAFSPDGRQVAAGGIDQTVRIWATKDGEKMKKIENLLSITHALAYSADGNYLAFSGLQLVGPVPDPFRSDLLNEIKIWDIKEDKLAFKLVADTTEINALFVSQDAKYVATSAENGLAVAWQRDQSNSTYSTIWKTEQCRALSVSRDFRKIVTANNDGSTTYWELTSAK